MEYRKLNIEVTHLPEKSGELIFLSLPEGHRFLSELKSLPRIKKVDSRKDLSLFGERQDLACHNPERGKLRLRSDFILPMGIRGSDMPYFRGFGTITKNLSPLNIKNHEN